MLILRNNPISPATSFPSLFNYRTEPIGSVLLPAVLNVNYKTIDAIFVVWRQACVVLEWGPGSAPVSGDHRGEPGRTVPSSAAASGLRSAEGSLSQ